MSEPTSRNTDSSENLTPIKSGQVLNPKGINQHSKGKSLTQCLLNSGHEICKTLGGKEMQVNEYISLAMKQIVLGFFGNFDDLSPKEFKQKFEIVKMWMERTAPVSAGGVTVNQSEQKVIQIILNEKQPPSIIDVSGAETLDTPK